MLNKFIVYLEVKFNWASWFLSLKPPAAPTQQQPRPPLPPAQPAAPHSQKSLQKHRPYPHGTPATQRWPHQLPWYWSSHPLRASWGQLPAHLPWPTVQVGKHYLSTQLPWGWGACV